MPRGIYERQRRPVTDRIAEKVMPVPHCGCWIFLGALNPSGYGHINVGRMGVHALCHRVMFEHYKGPLTKGQCVRHTCDTPSCVNPDHLVAGTHEQNMRDMAARGRAAKGEMKAGAKLDEQSVRFIRNSTLTSRALAQKFGVQPNAIGSVRTGKAWRHVI